MARSWIRPAHAFGATLLALTPVAAAAQPPVLAEFRVFDGSREVTAQTTLRVTPAGDRDHVRTIEPTARPTIELSPGVYDVQARRGRPGAADDVAWAERLVVMHYPDEDGRHLQVINFLPNHGAIQVRVRRGAPTDVLVEPYPAADHDAAAARPNTANRDYLLFVLPAGRYDLRVRRIGPVQDPFDRWILDVEVPAGHTRLKILD